MKKNIDDRKTKLLCNYIYLLIYESNFKTKRFTATHLHDCFEDNVSTFYFQYIDIKGGLKPGKLIPWENPKFISLSTFKLYLDCLCDIKLLKKKKKYTTFNFKFVDIGEAKIEELKKEIMLDKILGYNTKQEDH